MLVTIPAKITAFAAVCGTGSFIFTASTHAWGVFTGKETGLIFLQTHFFGGVCSSCKDGPAWVSVLLEFDKKYTYFLSHSEICIFFTVWNHNETNNNENGNHVPSQVLRFSIVVDFFQPNKISLE